MHVCLCPCHTWLAVVALHMHALVRTLGTKGAGNHGGDTATSSLAKAHIAPCSDNHRCNDYCWVPRGPWALSVIAIAYVGSVAVPTTVRLG